MRTALLSLIPIVLLVSACDDKPSAGKIEDLLNETVKKQGGSDLFRYKHCNKTNGIEQTNNIYVASVTCTIEVYKSSAEIQRFQLGGSVGMSMLMTLGTFEAGDEKTKELDVPLTKSEQGWIMAN